MADRNSRTERPPRSGRTFSTPAGLAVRPYGAQPVQQSYAGPPARPEQFPMAFSQGYPGPAGAVRAAGLVRPAGDVPPATYQPGMTPFASAMLALGAEPIVNVAGFLSTLQRTVAQIMGPTVQVQSASIVKGARQSVSVPRTGLGRLLGIFRGEAPGWWVNINNLVVSASAPFALNGERGLNRAIARAVAQSTTWTNVQSGVTAPLDGGSLDAQFRSSDACSGGINFDQVWARACTRPVGSTAPVAQMTPIPPPVDTTPVTPAPSAVTQTCAVRLQAASHLRATQTFDIGSSPSFPAGTAVTVRGPAVARRGSLTLYPVSIAGQEGFMPLSSAEMAPCPIFASSSPASGGGTSIVTRPTTTPARPATPAVPGTNLASLSGDSNSMTYAWIALGVVAAFGVTAAVVKRKEIKAALSGHGHKRNGRRRSRRR